MPNSHPTHFVIAISSVSGGGKTTLVYKTAERLNASVLLFDDYRTVSQYPRTQQWLDGGCDINEWKTPQFARDVAALKRGESVTLPDSGKVVQPTEFVVIEEPMGRARAEMAPHIDFVAVIDTPLEIALARKVKRDASYMTVDDIEHATKEQLAESLGRLTAYLQGFLGHYLRASRRLYIAVQEQAIVSCDLVLDGELSADELAAQLVAAVKSAHDDSSGQ
jgi:uridine kinase